MTQKSKNANAANDKRLSRLLAPFAPLFVQKYLFAVFIAVLLCIGGALMFFVEDIETHRSAKLSDAMNDAVREEMDRQNNQAKSLAVAIASNEILAKALKERDRIKASEAIDGVLASFEGYGERGKFWLQLHTPNLEAFMRSWDRSDYGASLESFRKGLVYVRKTQAPFSSIELGKKLNFKAIAPMRLNGEYVGSLEVIKNFDEAVGSFKEKKISLLVLMDNKFLETAEWMSDYPILGDFILCHREFDKRLYEELKEEDIYFFIGRKKSFTKNYFVSTEPLRDLSGERLGFFVAAMPKDMARGYMREEGDISFLISVSKDELSVAYKNRALKQSASNGEFEELSQKEDREERVRGMSREELENMALYGDKKSLKIGEIR